jgi:predicted ATPase/transcriptional regulator with XRE-family HTH domain
VGQERSATFGELLRDFRLAAGLSQEKLAERAGMSTGGISVLERGFRRVPYRDTVELLANGLGLSSDDRRQLVSAAVRIAQPRRRHSTDSSETLYSGTHNLPIELTSFIDREADIAQLGTLLDGSRLVTIVGTGGVGKTRTALRIAQALVGTVDGGVWFVDLAPLSDGSALATTIANVLGAAQTSNRAPLESLLAFVARRNLVIVLDNCEHVLGEAARVSEAMLRASECLRLLATSREALKTPAERVYRLPPLPTPNAIALFVSRAEAVDHSFSLSDQAARLASDICTRLDGIPLAIELAAARTGSIPLVTLAEKLHQRLSIGTDGGRAVSARHQTLRFLIYLSYALLQPSAQRLFEQLSIFAGGATLATATSVCGGDGLGENEVLEILALLVDKSLVVPDFDHEEPRYTLLESVRHYGRGRLASRGEVAATARRHAVALLELAERYEREWEAAPHPKWRELLQVEMDNWRVVLEWTLVSREDVQLGQRLVCALHHAWVTVTVSDAQRWLRVARESCVDGTSRSIVAQLNYVQAKIAQRAGETQVALDAASLALSEFRELGDVRRSIRAQRIVADALLMLGRVSEAESLFEEALEMARSGGYRWSAAYMLQSLGRLSADSGRPDEARERFRASLTALRALGEEDGATNAAINLAEAEFQAGDAATALRLAEEALANRIRHARTQMRSLPNMPAYLTALDRFDEALVHGREVLRFASQVQNQSGFAWALQHFLAPALLGIESTDERAAQKYRDAARVLGFIDALLASLGATREYTEEQEYQRLLHRLQGSLDPDELARSMAVGATTSGDSAIEIAEAVALN